MSDNTEVLTIYCTKYHLGRWKIRNVRTQHLCNAKRFTSVYLLMLKNVCKAVDENEKNVRLDLTHNMQVEAWGAPCPTTEQQRRGKREEELAEHKDCLFSQLYNVTPIAKKLNTLPAKTTITPQITDRCGCSG